MTTGKAETPEQAALRQVDEVRALVTRWEGYARLLLGREDSLFTIRTLRACSEEVRAIVGREP